MKKEPAAVALGRRGGLKGGAARAAKMSPEQRSASARKAVRARWAKAGKVVADEPSESEKVSDTSDSSLAELLMRLRVATDLSEIRLLSEQIERVVFHKQFEDA